jgi:hypothetical protein
MLWDVLNQLVGSAIGVLHFWMALLPDSPIYLSSAQISAVAGIAGYFAWAMPLSAMAVTFGLFIVGVATWVTVLLVKQLIESLLP